MKKLTKILSFSLVSVLFLAACSSSQTGGSTGMETVKTEVLVTAPSDSAKTDSEVPTSRYDNVKCSQLKVEGARQECEIQVNDMIGSMLEREIISTFDVGRCGQLSGDAGKNCQERLGATGVKGPVSAEEIAVFNEIARGSFAAGEGAEASPYPTYNIARCAELKTSGYRAYCEKEIKMKQQRNLFNQIVQENEGVRCGELSDEAMKADCDSYFNN